MNLPMSDYKTLAQVFFSTFKILLKNHLQNIVDVFRTE